MKLANSESKGGSRLQICENLLSDHAMNSELAVLPEFIQHEVIVEISMVHMIA